MIEVLAIDRNPVTKWESYAEDFYFRARRRGFSRIGIEHRTMGGFWQASFRMHHDSLSLQEFFLNGLGREVKAFNSYGESEFEGEVISLRLSGIGGTVQVRKLDQIANKVWVRYKDAADAFQRSAVAEDSESQLKLGILEMVLSGGQMTSPTVANNLATQVLSRRAEAKAYPESWSFGGQGDVDRSLEVTVGGWIRRFARRVYNQTASTGVQAANLEIADIVAATGQFVAATRLEPNPLGATKVYDADRDPLGIMFDIAGLGDQLSPPQRWALYMDRGRVLVFEPAAPAMRIAA